MKVERFDTEKTIETRGACTVVIDGKDFAPGRHSDDDDLNPREQVEVLQKLVKIMEKEDWDVWVLFNGEPLRQVEHGGEFMGLRVFFSPTPPQRIPTLLECVKVLKNGDRDTLMVSNDTSLESRASELGAATMRASTLRKGYEALFVTRGRPQSRLMRHRTVDRQKTQAERRITDMIDLVDDD